MKFSLPLTLFLLLVTCLAHAAENRQTTPTLEPLVRTVDLNLGQSATLILCDGKEATVKLLALKEKRDDLRGAVREARVTVEVNGEKAEFVSATYHLPTDVGGVQIDCPVTKGHVQDKSNPWSLDADARLRLWPAGSPWIRPGTLHYPVPQRWFASQTLMANQIADGDPPGKKFIYYHWGLDFGGAEDLVEVQAATDGVVVSARGKVLEPGKYPPLVKPRYDVVYIRDARGWFYRYSHLNVIDKTIQVGTKVKMGQKLGLLGKEGASGGWTHLHFSIVRPQPSGRAGEDDAYAFVWQAYREQYSPKLIANARPHLVSWTNKPVTLDGTRSWSVLGPDAIKKYEWTLSNGKTAQGPKTTVIYNRAGTYNEILKVTDNKGRADYDFAVVRVSDPNNPNDHRPGIHAAYWPTFDIKPGQPITFKVRASYVKSDEGKETWDFGDGSPKVTTQSDGNQDPHNKNGYAITTYTYKKPGHYLVSVSRTNSRGETATDRLEVRVGE
ncbi:MAG: PKD domain-containing protein [Pirellulales bacterium]|nr:PKD domain-containing protein [Pirellulales bacterium]